MKTQTQTQTQTTKTSQKLVTLRDYLPNPALLSAFCYFSKKWGIEVIRRKPTIRRGRRNYIKRTELERFLQLAKKAYNDRPHIYCIEPQGSGGLIRVIKQLEQALHNTHNTHAQTSQKER